MIFAAIPECEDARLRDLFAYEILDTPDDPRFDAIVSMAARMFDVPIVAVSLIASDHLWFKAKVGLDASRMPRNTSICGHVLLEPDQLLVLEDASADPRFHDNPLVAGEPFIRFYAGAPLISSRTGLALGTICLIDRKPRKFSEAEQQNLRDLATSVVSAMDLHRANLRLKTVATHDPLTHLPNRTLFETNLLSSVENLRDSDLAAVLYLDVDHLKDLNAGYGRETGDELLARLAELLRSTIDADQTAARLEGDKFCVLMPYCSEADEPARLAERLLARLAEQTFEIGGSSHRMSVSIGYALFPDHGADGPALVRAAGAALQQAKREGRGRAVGASQIHASLVDDSRGMEEELREALRSGSLYLRWQRYVSVHDGGTLGYEALIRWQSERYGEVAPRLFIPLAERIGIIGELDRFALLTACRTAAGWPEDTRINVNVSPFWFSEGRIFDLVRDCLAETSLSPSRLMLEVTERTIIEYPEPTRQQFQALRDIGVRIALDDFGTGYSSLGAVSEFDIDQIKLDISLISKIGKDPRADGVARCVIQLARDLDLTVVAEGVETERQYELIRDLGCDAAQGFFFGRPDSKIDFDVAKNDGLPLSLLQWTPRSGLN